MANTLSRTSDEVADLDKITFEQWLLDNKYPQEVMDWCDVYCPTDASGYPRNMCRFVVLPVCAREPRTGSKTESIGGSKPGHGCCRQERQHERGG